MLRVFGHDENPGLLSTENGTNDEAAIDSNKNDAHLMPPHAKPIAQRTDEHPLTGKAAKFENSGFPVRFGNEERKIIGHFALQNSCFAVR